MQKLHQKSPSAHHRTTLSGSIYASKACIDNWNNLLNTNISSGCPQNMMNFSPLTTEIGWQVCGTAANFIGFRVLTSLLHRHRSTEINQTLHNVWPSPALVYYICIFGGSCPLMEFCQLQNSLCIQLLRSPTLVALLHGTQALPSARVCGVVQGMELWNFRRGRQLYLAGQPSRWTVGHRPTF